MELNIPQIGGSPALSGFNLLTARQAVHDRLGIQKARLNQAKALYEDLIGSLDQVVSLLGSFSSRAHRLTVVNPAPSSVAVALGSAAAAGSHSLEILQAAAPHILSSQAYAADGTDFAGQTGSFTIALGDGSQAEIDYAIAAGATNDEALGQVADAIRAAGLDVTAARLRVGGDVRLVLTGPGGGTDGIIASVADGEGSLMSALGLAGSSSPGSFSPATVGEPHEAQFVLDGIALTSPTNLLENVLPGVTLTLLGPTEGPVRLEIIPDEESSLESLDQFVAGFNDLVDLIASATQAGGDLTERGALRDSQNAARFVHMMRSALRPVLGGDGAGPELSDLGLEIDPSGHLLVKDRGALAEALRAGLLEENGSEAPAGALGRLMQAVLPFSGPLGILSGEQSNLTTRAKALDEYIRRSEERMIAREKALLEQLAAIQEIGIRLQSQIQQLQLLGAFQQS